MQARSFAVTPRAAWFLALAALAPAAALAQVDIHGAWARGTVPAQTATGAFMTLHAHEPARLLGVSTPVAGRAEVHEMKMDGNVMRMRAIDALPLPRMQDVELKPGGYHVMLLDLKGQLKAGDSVPLTLRFEQGGKVFEQRVNAEVRSLTAAAASTAPASHGAGHKH